MRRPLGEGTSRVLQFRVPVQWVAWLAEWVDVEHTQSSLLREAVGKWLKARGYKVDGEGR